MPHPDNYEEIRGGVRALGTDTAKLKTTAVRDGELFFDNLEVPAGNLIDTEGSGFKYIAEHVLGLPRSF